MFIFISRVYVFKIRHAPFFCLFSCLFYTPSPMFCVFRRSVKAPASTSSSHPHQTDFIHSVWLLRGEQQATSLSPVWVSQLLHQLMTNCSLYGCQWRWRHCLRFSLCWIRGFIFKSRHWDVCGQRGLLFSGFISPFDKWVVAFSSSDCSDSLTLIIVCYFWCGCVFFACE